MSMTHGIVNCMVCSAGEREAPESKTSSRRKSHQFNPLEVLRLLRLGKTKTIST